ncbi:MAG: hypothetical protein JW814_02515 [Candidatus Krumholzibacteriota bacterium]|nr:hypothetical protein [Candidatus Krumholzibacteriota bacterium]
MVITGRSILTFLFVSLLALSPARISAGEGSKGGSFLPLGWDARGEGLAGAASLLVRNDCSAYWNPANLVFLETTMMTLGTMKPVPDLNNRYSILSIGTGLLDTRVSPDGMVSMRRFAAALSVTHLGLDLSEGSGWNESTIGLAGAFSPNHFNSFGIGCKLLKGWTDLDNADSWGFALDIGWTTRLHKNIWFALVGRNFNGTVHYPENDYDIDSSINIAISWENIFDRVSVECDAVSKEGEMNRFLFGSEIIIAEKLLHITCGADMRLVNGSRTIPHVGLLSNYRDILIALSFRFDPLDAFGRQTRISIGYGL